LIPLSNNGRKEESKLKEKKKKERKKERKKGTALIAVMKWSDSYS
jgi:hypothetical protein